MGTILMQLTVAGVNVTEYMNVGGYVGESFSQHFTTNGTAASGTIQNTERWRVGDQDIGS